jgi:HAD superfamily hydrolase (TIGR01484 family)
VNKEALKCLQMKTGSCMGCNVFEITKSRINKELSMLYTLAAVVVLASIFIFFSQEFTRMFKKIMKIKGVGLLLPLLLGSYAVYGLNDWVLTDEEGMPVSVRENILSVLKEFITANASKYDIGTVVEGDQVVEDRTTQITMSSLGQHAPIDLKKNWDPNQVKRQEIKEELEKKLPEVSINIGGSTSIDILPKGFNKASGLKRLLGKLGMTIDDMVFVGDAIFPGGNDYSPYEAGIESIKISGPKETKEVIKKWLL